MKYWLLLLVALLANSAGAEIYRWVDDQGKVHFSDSKPMDRAAEKKEYPAGDGALDPELEKHRQERDVQLQEWEMQQALDKQANDDAERKKKQDEHNCNVVKSNLTMDDQVSVVYTMNPDGSRRAMTADERRKRREGYLLKKEQYCH